MPHTSGAVCRKSACAGCEYTEPPSCDSQLKTIEEDGNDDDDDDDDDDDVPGISKD